MILAMNLSLPQEAKEGELDSLDIVVERGDKCDQAGTLFLSFALLVALL